jgi:hypothetical protein
MRSQIRRCASPARASSRSQATGRNHPKFPRFPLDQAKEFGAGHAYRWPLGPLPGISRDRSSSRLSLTVVPRRRAPPIAQEEHWEGCGGGLGAIRHIPSSPNEADRAAVRVPRFARRPKVRPPAPRRPAVKRPGSCRAQPWLGRPASPVHRPSCRFWTATAARSGSALSRPLPDPCAGIARANTDGVELPASTGEPAMRMPMLPVMKVSCRMKCLDLRAGLGFGAA